MLAKRLIVVCVAVMFAAQDGDALWPHPRNIKQATGARSYEPKDLKLTSEGTDLAQDVHDAFARTIESIAKNSYQGLNPPTGNASSAGGIKEVKVNFGKLKAVERSVSLAERNGNWSISREAIQKIENLNEEYALRVPATGPIEIDANSNLGLLRAFSTLELLTLSAGPASTRYIQRTPIEIRDKPAYPYRGFLIDTSRNYYSVAAIKRQLDAAALVKLNQFHWHIVDSHSWPLVLPGELAVLSQKGAYSSEQVYRREDVEDIVNYAAARGINVNVELDMPGHNYAGVKDYDPSLIVCPNKPDWVNWANEPPSGQLDLRNPKTNTYVKKVIEATSALFPGPYFSTGNDEVNLKCYNATKKSDIDASLLKPFVQHAHKVVSDQGKTPMVWEEAAIDFPETGKSLLPNTLVQVWISAESVGKVLAANDKVRVINSPLDRMYLDLGRGEWLTGALGQSYSPYCTWGSIYTYNPLNGTTSANAHRVVGSEVLLWSEQSDDATVDQLLWPRAAALAEILWTGAKKTVNDKTEALDVEEATFRLNVLRSRLVKRGVNATPLQPQWCLNNKCPNPES